MERKINYLNVPRFKTDFCELYELYIYKRHSTDEKDKALDIAVKIIDEAGNSVDCFLRLVDNIPDVDIQKCCRLAAIAQMYDAEIDYRRGYPYVDCSGYRNVAFVVVDYKMSTAVVSNYGEILFDKDEIWLNTGAYYNGGFPVRKVIDGHTSNKYGFINAAGLLLLPCIFDNADMHIGESNFIYNVDLQIDESDFIFESVTFELRLLGQIDKLSDRAKKSLQYSIESGNNIVCLVGSTLFSLSEIDNWDVPEECLRKATDEIISLLSDRVVSMESPVVQDLLSSE